MKYQEIKPGNRLAPYIKCYYIYESDVSTAFDDTVFPSGCIEVIFNLGSGKWQIVNNDVFINNPSIELWGQITKPLPVRSVGKNTMLGIRFFPHAAACFIDDKIELLNNQVTDFRELSDHSLDTLYSKLQHTPSWNERITCIEDFLLKKLSLSESRFSRLPMVTHIMNEIRQEDFFDNMENVASRHGISTRYVQKLFLQYTGLTPKLYSKIARFQDSLRLVTQKNASLTSIAYDCGYFDQSHFIREFKSFTGLTPSGYAQEHSPISVAFAGH